MGESKVIDKLIFKPELLDKKVGVISVGVDVTNDVKTTVVSFTDFDSGCTFVLSCDVSMSK